MGNSRGSRSLGLGARCKPSDLVLARTCTWE